MPFNTGLIDIQIIPVEKYSTWSIRIKYDIVISTYSPLSTKKLLAATSQEKMFPYLLIFNNLTLAKGQSSISLRYTKIKEIFYFLILSLTVPIMDVEAINKNFFCNRFIPVFQPK